MEDITTIIGNCLGVALGIFCAICFLTGYILGPERVPPLTTNGVNSTRISNQSLYAIASGDEEYLAAHCTLNATSANDLEQEKLHIQRLKNKITIARLKRELQDLEERTSASVKVDKKQNPIKNKGELDNLAKECTLAMMSLGYKEKQAEKIVKDYLINNPKTKTPEEFIKGVFKK